MHTLQGKSLNSKDLGHPLPYKTRDVPQSKGNQTKSHQEPNQP